MLEFRSRARLGWRDGGSKLELSPTRVAAASQGGRVVSAIRSPTQQQDFLSEPYNHSPRGPLRVTAEEPDSKPSPERAS